jgi:hypothetical protein
VKILETYWLEEEEEDASGTQGADASAGFSIAPQPVVPPGGFNFSF